MDSPIAHSDIQYLDNAAGSFEDLIFSAERDGKCPLVRTGEKKGELDKSQFASVHGSIDGESWKRVAELPHDLPWTRGLRPYSQRPNAPIVAGDGAQTDVSVLCIGLKNLEGRTMQWSRSELESRLGEP